MRRLTGSVAAVLLSCTACECQSIEPIVARLCYVVEVEDLPERIEAFRTGRQLEPWLKEFAASEGLGSLHRPGEVRHSLSWASDGVMVSLSQAMGYRRAWIYLHRDDLADPRIEARFTEFLYSEIGQEFTVFPCTDIEGAEMPVLYNWKLR